MKVAEKLVLLLFENNKEERLSMEHTLFDIRGKKAFVTGSGSGIGLGIAEGLLEAGAIVVLHSRSDSAVKEAKRLSDLGYKARAITGDLESVTDVEHLFQKAISILGNQIDILVNCAGTQYRSPATEFPIEKYDEIMAVNARSMFAMCKCAAPYMMERRYGKISNIASMQSFFGIPNTPAYAASKGAVAQLTKALGNEWISKGINVNALAPGWIATKLTKAVVEDADRTREIMGRLPAGRWGLPSDFKGPAIFLASAASDYLSGVILPVDGGYLTR